MNFPFHRRGSKGKMRLPSLKLWKKKKHIKVNNKEGECAAATATINHFFHARSVFQF